MPDTPVTFTHATGSYLRVGDAEIYHEFQGDLTQPTLLLLHGGLGDLTDFNAVAAPLARHFRLLGVDTRGHGRSTLGSAALTYQRCEADVLTLLDHHGIDRCAVLGFSDGGIVGYRLAAHHGARVTSLVAVGAQWRLDPSDAAYGMLGGLTAEMWDSMFPESRGRYESVNPEPDFERLVQRAVELWTDLTPTSYPGDRVRHIAAPTLVVRGDSDPLLSLAEVAALQACLPGASVFNLPFAGHEAHRDSPHLFLQVVEDFLLQPRGRSIEGA